MTELTCRLCLNHIEDHGFINLELSKEKQLLILLLPDLDLHLVEESLVCLVCVKLLHSAYDFRNCCLQSEKLICDYIKDKGSIKTLNGFKRNAIRDNAMTKCEGDGVTEIKVEPDLNLLDQNNSPSNEEEPQNVRPKYDIEFYNIKSDFDDKCKVERETGGPPTVPSDNEEDETQKSEPATDLGHWMTQEDAAREMSTMADRELDDFSSVVYLKYFNCKICNYRTPQLLLLQNHMKVHSMPNALECANCDYKALKRINLYKHMKAVHMGEKPYKCKICDYKTSETSNLRTHVKIHTGEKPFECYVCKHKFLRKSDLQNHVKLHTGERPFNCDVCHRKFLRNVDLTLHSRVHTGDKPYQCEICKKKFSTKGRHKTHMMVHRGERPYECEVCKLKFSDKSILKGHARTHSDKKPFQCDVCDYKCARNSNLIVHKRIHTGEKPFMCDVCNYKTSYREHLSRHMRVHGCGKTFECNMCEFKTLYRQNLYKHIKVHTRRGVVQCETKIKEECPV